jgi:integrase
VNNSIENQENDEWLDKMYRSSKSNRTKVVAQTTLKVFDLFCKDQGMERHQDPDLEYGYIPKMIEQYLIWFNPKPNPEVLVRPEIEKIGKSLDRFVGFMDEDREDILISKNATFKKKSPKTIAVYFGFLKSYLRYVHSVKLSTDDIKDFVTFPKEIKYQRQALTLKQLKAIMNNASAKRRALYYVLASSGMRVGEALTLTKRNIHMEENPVRITIDAENTKTNEDRETYISSEAVEKLIPILETVKDEDSTFFMPQGGDLDYYVIREDKIFGYLREKLGIIEATKLGINPKDSSWLQKYKNSVRHKVRIHGFRSHFHTLASRKHSTEYANALDGHSGYLPQYYTLTPEKRAQMYKELEPELYIESVKMESDKTKDKIIEGLTEQMAKMEAKMSRIELLNQ